ncbi:MAG TPA: hypothetical protein VL418_03915 [Devosiaceae bacterium]|jgi:hypothetical protein|nr:hypothetical protein [Devosiaceae bacterium]
MSDWWLETIVCVMLGVSAGIYWPSIGVAIATAAMFVITLIIAIASGAWAEAIAGWIGGSLAIGLTLAARSVALSGRR